MQHNVELAEVTAQLSNLIEAVEQGDEVMVSRAGRPIARIIPARDEIDRMDSFAAIEEMKAIRQRSVLGPGLTLRDLIDDGRR